jgi:hypothetical protein
VTDDRVAAPAPRTAAAADAPERHAGGVRQSSPPFRIALVVLGLMAVEALLEYGWRSMLVGALTPQVVRLVAASLAEEHRLRRSNNLTT